jgi:MtrB/PioB family decaheme-associated outer membrane protein
MKVRAGLLATCAALVIGAGFASPAFAEPPTLPAAGPLWVYDGYAEVGGRFDLNNPNKTTLGKFYEYRDLRPGVFGNFFFGAHRSDGLFDIEAWGKNVGWDDQAYGLYLANPGMYYFTFGWDETPHVFSKNAKTLYSGVGTNYLTIQKFLAAPPGADDQAAITANSRTIDLEFRRDTASATGRWTPSDNWDFNIDYSHDHRHGTQGTGAVSFSNTNTRSTFEIPKPVDDVTQNAHLKGEYSGSTPWNTPFNISVAGGYSTYENSFNSVIFQNPWNPVNKNTAPLNNQYSLAPDNQASSVNVSGGVGLPFNSRYMGTFQYTKMTSDQANLPFSINPFVLALNGNAFSAPSRETTTILSNNVLHTQITSNVKSTLKYRYYDYSAQNMPAIIFNPRAPNPDSTSGFPDEESAIRYPTSYNKQNADAQLVYSPWQWLSVGALYDWERWSRKNRDTWVTKENTGKIFADAKFGWSTLRTSLQYGERRYDQYRNPPIAGGTDPAARMRDLANRDRTKGQVSWAIDVTHELTVTPNGGFLYDDYKTNVNFSAPGASEVGMKKNESWNAGVDATLTINRMVAVFFSYSYEYGFRDVYLRDATPDLEYQTTDRNNTFIFGTKMTLIPEKLFLDTSYTVANGTSKWVSNCTPFGCRYGPPLATFPDIHNKLQRLDTQLKYVFDDSVMRSAGFSGKAYMKFRLLWEKNSNDSWQSLQNQFGWLVNPGNATTAYSIWFGNGNPNYDVLLGQVALGLEW